MAKLRKGSVSRMPPILWEFTSALPPASSSIPVTRGANGISWPIFFPRCIPWKWPAPETQPAAVPGQVSIIPST